MTKVKPAILMILDGFGLGDAGDPGDATKAADTPNLDSLLSERPHAKLNCAGLSVGLPDGQIGNSEVGHTVIGAGRVVYQSLTKISLAIEDGSFFENPALLEAMANAKETGKALHLMGLLGPGGVHSHSEHLYALLRLAKDRGLNEVYIHAFMDGRDTLPRSGAEFMDELLKKTGEIGVGRVASVMGRYYAMDRDKRWERLEKAYDALTLGEGLSAATATEAVEAAYARGENDEFILPTVVGEAACIESGDSVIFYNFRPDRAREITRAFADKDFTGFTRKKQPRDLTYVCMCEYDADIEGVSVAYPPEPIRNTLGEWVSELGLRQLRLAETEKYAHVTFFLNGGREEPYPGEERILVPSPKVATYDLMPQMSAPEVNDKLLSAIEDGGFDLIVVNFANCDMVGHTGVMEAAIKAVETVDRCVGSTVKAAEAQGVSLLITADHGNAEAMIAPGGGDMTAHTCNPVPVIYVSADAPHVALHDGSLADLAPTILTMMGLPVPDDMTGRCLYEL